MNPVNFLCKYEGKMTALRKFAAKFPGYGDLSKLPSGTAQLQQIHHPVVAKLWAEQNPDRKDLNYDNPVASCCGNASSYQLVVGTCMV